MAYSKKPLFLFSTVALSTATVAGFFIRQKILNNWKIANLNSFLKQVADLEIEIQKDEKNLKDYEKLKAITEEENNNIDKKIHELEESTKNYGKQIEELESKHASWKQDINFINFLEIYSKLKKNTENDLEKIKSLNSYYRTISNHISNKKNMLHQIDKNKLNKETEEVKKSNLNKKKKENVDFLSELKNLINKLTKNMEDKKSKLVLLKKSRERERGRVN